MAKAIWNCLNNVTDRTVRESITCAILGHSPTTTLHCWYGPTPGADLIFADHNDVLYACIELKRRNSPSQYSSVHHAQQHLLFLDGSGKIDPFSTEIFRSVQKQRIDRHPADGDSCPNYQHTQRRRDRAGERVWRCAIPQIDLYRGFALLPHDGSTAVKPQDPANVKWILLADDKRPVAHRYPTAKSAACWKPRSWDDVITSLNSAVSRLGDRRVIALRDTLDGLR